MNQETVNKESTSGICYDADTLLKHLEETAPHVLAVDLDKMHLDYMSRLMVFTKVTQKVGLDMEEVGALAISLASRFRKIADCESNAVVIIALHMFLAELILAAKKS